MWIWAEFLLEFMIFYDPTVLGTVFCIHVAETFYYNLYTAILKVWISECTCWRCSGFSHRSGLNSSGSEKMSADRKWTPGLRSTWVPVGIWYPESTIGLSVYRDTSVPFGQYLQHVKMSWQPFCSPWLGFFASDLWYYITQGAKAWQLLELYE